MKADAGIAGPTFHDLRGTAVTRSFLAACREAEIATIMGHSPEDVQPVPDAYPFYPDTRLADSEIATLETAIRAAAAAAMSDNASVVVGEARTQRQLNGYKGARKGNPRAS